MEKSKVAFIGLGAMGSRIAQRLLAAGNELVVWNRTPEKAADLDRQGAVVASTPAEAAAQAEVVITMVSNPEALRAVTEGADGVAAGLTKGAIVIEMSTVGPEAVARLASVLPAGAGLIDAPVLGSVGEAESGTLTIFVGGPTELYEQNEQLLSALGTPVHVGPLGAGAAAKLVANSTLFGVLGVFGEALALAAALGLARDAAFRVLEASPLAAQVERRRASVEANDFPPRFPLSLARKDADLIAEAAEHAGLDLRLAPAARAWLVDAERDGHGDEDYSSTLARILEGLQFG
jgi:3-hydroxyisobutyrate dehydrogenase-like beta-hydroxyacid dehydrogenase